MIDETGADAQAQHVVVYQPVLEVPHAAKLPPNVITNFDKVLANKVFRAHREANDHQSLACTHPWNIGHAGHIHGVGVCSGGLRCSMVRGGIHARVSRAEYEADFLEADDEVLDGWKDLGASPGEASVVGEERREDVWVPLQARTYDGVDGHVEQESPQDVSLCALWIFITRMGTDSKTRDVE